MEYARLSSLLVIALLQLSQTEISNTLPEPWYVNPNVINEGVYSPRPLSEIFPTEATFSPTNPIVVLPNSQSTPGTFFSTSTLPNIAISTPTISTTFGTTTERPATEVSEVSVVPLSTEPPLQPQPVPVSTGPPLIPTIIVNPSQATQPPQPPQLTQLTNFPQFQQPPAPSSTPPILSIPQQIQVLTALQGSPPSAQQTQNQPPNYVLVYQQVPQALQNYPSSPPPLIPSNLPVVTSTTLPPSVTTTNAPPCSTTQAPCVTSTGPCAQQANSQLPTFRIRMIGPSGSVTNVGINENPAATIITRRPTTTRTRRRNRNNYDGCVNGCGGTRFPICASPLGLSPIDPDTLKGFPSVCHMACHNSFRKNLYEKVVDGKCGRLRTRIRPIDSNNKLKRDDLNKASYTIVQEDGPTIFEFSPLSS